VLVRADKHAVGEEGKGDACCGDLGKGYPKEDHTSQYEIHPDQGTNTPNQHAPNQGFAQEKAWADNLD
jgi:hypothetical protein